METLIHNLIEHKRQIAIGTASVIAGAALLIGYFRSGPDALSYVRAEAAFSQWEASPQNEELYQGMQKAIGTVPSLKKKYEGAIAQRLLDMEKIPEALAMARASLNRVRGDVPFHSAYGETSLLIQQGQFQEALQRAVALKEEMSSLADGKEGALLYAYNLLRIASLQQELKNRPGEKAGWEELESYLQRHGETAVLLFNDFSENTLSLSQYIAERKRSL